MRSHNPNHNDDNNMVVSSSMSNFNAGDHEEGTSTTTLEDMISAFRVDWLAVNQRLRLHPHEARTLSCDSNCRTTTILHRVLQRRPSNYPPLQTVRLLLAIFPQAAWLGVETCSSPLHLVARHNPLPDYLALVQGARPSIMPQDIQVLRYQWEFYVRAWGGGSEQALVESLLRSSSNNDEDDYCAGEANCFLPVQLAGSWEYMVQYPLRRDVSFGLHTVAALTTNVELLQLALEVFSHHVDKPCAQHGRLPLHSFLATTAGGRPSPVFASNHDIDHGDETIHQSAFRFPFDLLPLLRVLVRAFPAALQIRDGHGQLPLHVAIAAGWDEFDVLLVDHPDSLQSIDGQSGWLLPYQLAAVSPASSLDTVYHLLRRSPSVLQASPLPHEISYKSMEQHINFKTFDTTFENYPQSCSVSEDLLRLVFKVGEAECSRLWKSLQILLTDYKPSARHSLLAGLPPHCPRALLQVMIHFYYPAPCCCPDNDDESSPLQDASQCIG